MSERGVYTFSPAFRVTEETARLDKLDNALYEYFGGKLSLAPLEDMKPTKVLEIGSGSGAWAIRAAMMFPGAEVLAADISPLPERPIPNNLHFVQTDLTQDKLPFDKESFDIVHGRFVFMHLPNGTEILKRTMELVKPGGWFLVEEPDDEAMKDGENPLPDGFRNFVSWWLSLIRSKDAEPCIGRSLSAILGGCGLFSEVNVRKTMVPYSCQSKDSMENILGDAWRALARRNGEDFPKRLEKEGMTADLVQPMLNELDDPNRCLTTDLYFTWSRRKTY